MNRFTTCVCLAGFALVPLLLCADPVAAQSGGPYDLRWNSIDGGGATFATGGSVQLGATIGQPDAGTQSGGTYLLTGGFWAIAGLVSASTPTPTTSGADTATPTRSPTMTLTPAGSRTVSMTATVTPTGVATGFASATPSMSSTPHGTATPTATPTPSPTPDSTPPASCVGDCSNDNNVTIDELVVLVNIALDTRPYSDCPAGDSNGDRSITVDELVTAVNRALNGCEL